MEDVDAPEVEAWVTAQNTLTRSVLDPVPGRERLHTRLLALTNFERVSAPTIRNNRFVFAHNTGLQNQAVLFWQDGAQGEPHLLLDPNTLSADGTVALAGLALSDDGTRLAYALAEAGSDWISWHVREIGTGPNGTSPDLPDRITRSKFSSASWLPDGSGFLYSGYGPPEEAVISTEVQPPSIVISTEGAERRSGEIPSLQSPTTLPPNQTLPPTPPPLPPPPTTSSPPSTSTKSSSTASAPRNPPTPSSITAPTTANSSSAATSPTTPAISSSPPPRATPTSSTPSVSTQTASPSAISSP